MMFFPAVGLSKMEGGQWHWQYFGSKFILSLFICILVCLSNNPIPETIDFIDACSYDLLYLLLILLELGFLAKDESWAYKYGLLGVWSVAAWIKSGNQTRCFLLHNKRKGLSELMTNLGYKGEQSCYGGFVPWLTLREFLELVIQLSLEGQICFYVLQVN